MLSLQIVQNSSQSPKSKLVTHARFGKHPYAHKMKTKGTVSPWFCVWLLPEHELPATYGVIGEVVPRRHARRAGRQSQLRAPIGCTTANKWISPMIGDGCRCSAAHDINLIDPSGDTERYEGATTDRHRFGMPCLLLFILFVLLLCLLPWARYGGLPT